MPSASVASNSIQAHTPRRGPTSKLPADKKQDLLDNFDLEVDHKTRQFRIALNTMLESFSRRQETEVMRIPKELRSLTMRDLNAQWGGSWSATLQKIKQAALEKERREEKGDDVVEKVEEMRKRKRGDAVIADASAEAGPSKRTVLPSSRQSSRTSRAPRIKKPAPTGTSTPLRRTTRTRAGSIAPPSPAPPAQTTNFPTTTSFAPSLPATPAFPRPPRRDEPLISANGSPLANPYSESDDDDNELPDVEAMEATILAQSMRPSAPTIRTERLGISLNRGKSVRRSFIRIRPSISASQSSGYRHPDPVSDSQATPRGRLVP